jgi:hypothetical protein
MPNNEETIRRSHRTPRSTERPEGMRYAFEQILRPAFPDLQVQIHQQLAEGDK